MIFMVTHHETSAPIADAARGGREQKLADIRLLNYCDLFTRRRAPVGHYVFTDFDRLTSSRSRLRPFWRGVRTALLDHDRRIPQRQAPETGLPRGDARCR